MATVANYGRKPKLFSYGKRFDEALKRGQVYWPGESVKKFGLQIANIEPVRVAEGEEFEYGEVVVLDSDGNARTVQSDDTDFYGIVHRNATATYHVLDEQIMGMAPRMTLSVFRGGREGVISVPVQNVDGDTEISKGDDVYIRVDNTGKEHLPLGGIENVDEEGTVKWEGAKFSEPVTFPFKEERYATEEGLTTAVAGVEYH